MLALVIGVCMVLLLLLAMGSFRAVLIFCRNRGVEFNFHHMDLYESQGCAQVRNYKIYMFLAFSCGVAICLIA